MTEFAIPRRKFRKEPGTPLRGIKDMQEWERQVHAHFDGTHLREYLTETQALARAVFKSARLSLDRKHEHIRCHQIVAEYESGKLEATRGAARHKLERLYLDHQQIKALAKSQIDSAVYCAAQVLHKAAFVRFDSTPAALAHDMVNIATWRERMLYTLALSNTKTATDARIKNKQLRLDKLERHIRDHGKPPNNVATRKTLGYAPDRAGRKMLERDLADVCANLA